MFIAHRLLLVLGLIGAAVGLFLGVRGMITAHEAVSSVNRKGGDAESLFHADRLDRALDKVRAKVGPDGKLRELTVYPGYLMVQATAGSNGDGRTFRVQGNGAVTKAPDIPTAAGLLGGKRDRAVPGQGQDGRGPRQGRRRQGACHARRRHPHHHDDRAGLRRAGLERLPEQLEVLARGARRLGPVEPGRGRRQEG